MKYVFVLLTILGIAASSLALREHYREGDSPCSINDHWDCGIVNHSPYAMFHGIPVAVIGIAGYIVMGLLGWRRSWRLLLLTALLGLGVSLYLANIEKNILGVWCIYCVISLCDISLITLLALATTGVSMRRPLIAPNP